MLTSDLIESSFKKINSAEMKSLGFMDLLELHRYLQNTRLQTARGLLLFLNFSFYNLLLPCMEKAMAPHSSTLAWKIPWTEEPGRLQSMGSLRVGHD